MLLEQQGQKLLDAFSEAAKQLKLTFEQIRELKPIPRSFFPVTQASLLLAERRGELPKPILFNGKLCYSAVEMAEKALSRFVPIQFLIESQGKHLAMALLIYRDHGDPRSLMAMCYTKKISHAEGRELFRELVLSLPEGDMRDLGIYLADETEAM